ncbi:4259_t:CDS:10 [Paraglomus occultum]|uniref:4259_t:CDS:1 n=1 Tax=Paraglomus occultum TaxID=144539 RepID=A0A9N9C5P9_9GLOM|nr:4259_t:CDS:10 [Paraglomus occultum]
MFLEWITELGLLEHDPDSGVLSKFPLNVQKSLISEITQTLLQTRDSSLLPSPAHVQWVMEAVGQGFALPLEEMDITANSKELYSQWLFEPNCRPAAIRDLSGKPEEQRFWQVIFHHYSLLFRPRTSSSNTSQTSTPTAPNFPALSSYNDFQRHVELCKGVLIVLTMAGRTLGSQFSEETWRVLLKVVLGITDYLLREHISTVSSDNSSDRYATMSMGDELCEHLLRVLFELWLRSKIQEVDMWDILQKCFNKWTHRQQAINQWNAAILGLTQRIVRILYGPREGADVVNISVGGYNVGLDLPNEYVRYAWYRMTYLIDNPCRLPSANFALAINGIGRIIEVLHSVGMSNYSKVGSSEVENSLDSMANGNAILRMFASWLFEACSITRKDADAQQGRAEAFGILCRIFCSPQPETLHRTYITQFYLALTEGLRVDSCLPTILMNTTSLFATDLEGVRMMVPDFVVGIKMVLPKLASNFKTRLTLEELRLAAIRAAGTIMCLPNHFEKVSLKENWDLGMHQNGDKVVNDPDEVVVHELIRVLYSEEDLREKNHKDPSTQPFTALKYHILELLLLSLKTETSSYNLRYLLHLINVYVIEDVAFCPGLVGAVVKSIQEMLLTMNLPSDVTACAFDVLKDFVGLYHYIQRDSRNCTRELVLVFSRYIDNMLAGACGGLAVTYHLVEKAYDCMMRWILVGQWIVGDRDCHEAVIATISRGISIIADDDDSASQANAHTDKKKNRKENAPNKLFIQRGNKAATSSNESIPNNSGSARYGRKGESDVKLAAEVAMAQFVNHLGNFPAWGENVGPSRVSTLFKNDLNLAHAQLAASREHNKMTGELVRYFMIDGRVILGFVEMPKDAAWLERVAKSQELDDSKDAPSVIIVIRDSTGKYSWTTHMRYKPNPQHDNEQPKDIPNSLPLSNVPGPSSPTRTETPSYLFNNQTTNNTFDVPDVTAYAEKHAMPTLDSLLDKQNERKRAFNVVKKLTQKIKEVEERVCIEKCNNKSQQQSCKAVPPGLNTYLESPQVFRLFLAQMGSFSLENRHRVIPLRISRRFVEDLEKLDGFHERDYMTASVYYASSGEVNYEKLINLENYDDDFEKFLNALGWPMALESHPGYKGKLNHKICKTAPYFADRTVEIIFNVPILIRKPETNADYAGSLTDIFRTVAADDYVVIIWIEDLRGLHSLPHKIGMSGLVYICVHPLQNATGLYWIKIITPKLSHSSGTDKKIGKGKGVIWNVSTKLADNHLFFGPLVDGMIVSRHALGLLVRNTAISAHEACRRLLENYSKPYAVRRRFIEEIHRRHKSSGTISEYVVSSF